MSPRISSLLCAAAAGLFLTVAPSLQAEERAFRPPAGQILLSNVVYATRGDRQLHLELLLPQETSEQLRPAVLIVHGGGWSGGTHLIYAPWLVQQGYVTASVEYRLLTPEAPFPAQIEDCRAAVRWLRAHAAEYHLDPARIGCMGHSAGGHLVSWMGVLGEKTEYDLPGDNASQSSRVQAVVDEAGPSDFTPEAAPAVGGDRTNQYLVKLFGGTYEEKTALWRQSSPALLATNSAPPFLILHGEDDHMVPISQAEHMEAALKKAGVPVEFIRVRHGGHGLRQDKPDGPPAEPDTEAQQRAIVEFFGKNLKRP